MPRQSDGLSPLARGTPNIIQGINNYRRFIPAGAGNTQRSQTPEMEIPVYPRWRGEHATIKRAHKRGYGLSPLARGTRCQQTATIKRARFIPAGAGNTIVKELSVLRGAVYPRWRGEHKIPDGHFFTWPGLSPLARGTLPLGQERGVYFRFIPAGAGNTAMRTWYS